MKNVLILAIESSCDETACAIVKNGKEILSNVVASQIDVHTKYGGVVPEVASRIHIENISIVITEALEKANVNIDDIHAIAVTQGPGLIGSLHVGVIAAKSIAWMYNKPLISVQHIVGHIYANTFIKELKFPLLALVVSGGHTELVLMKKHYDFVVLGQTQDDAVGEAYDKVARVLNLGYPGGPIIDKLAKEGDYTYKLPKPKTEDKYNFSFSGLKSGVLQMIEREKKSGNEIRVNDMCASFQETALSILVEKTKFAIEQYNPSMVVLAGGVAANSRLRVLMEQLHDDNEATLVMPPMWCCTDNAAMIGAAAYPLYKKGEFVDLSIGALSSLSMPD